MAVAVWGLGHVGRITAAYLSKRTEHLVLGLDLRLDRVRQIETGSLHGINAELEETLSFAIANRRLQCFDLESCPPLPEIAAHFLCVGTPTLANGKQDAEPLFHACAAICRLRGIDPGTLIVIRSTVLPGTTDGLLIPYLERLAGKKEGTDFHVYVNPCFSREVDFSEDLITASRVVVGSAIPEFGTHLLDLYKLRSTRGFQVTCLDAELAKYTDNAFHALKIVFANEIGRLADRISADREAVLNILCSDSRLNLSSAYLRAGEAFGGNCLPKDMSALKEFISNLSLDLPVLTSIPLSNSK